MKILLINQDWFAQEFRDAGHEVLTLGAAQHLDIPINTPMLHIDTVLRALPNGFTPDVIMWHDNSAPLTLTGIEECSIPLAFYSVDTHHHAHLHGYLSLCFDHVFVAQKDYLNQFPTGDTSVSWLPLWASRYVDASSEKRFSTTFVGTLNAKLNPNRVAFFDALQTLIPIHLDHGRYWEIFPHAEVVINQTVKGDLNFRVFEAMMCGSLLLTERTPNGLLEIFTDDVHLATYTPNDPHDAARRANELLANPEKMRRIAAAGREEILAKHTPRHRAEEVLAVLKNLSRREPSPLRYFAMLVNHNVVATIAEDIDTALVTKALIAALRAGEQALHIGSVPSQFEASHLIIAAIRYDRMVRSDAGKRLVFRYAEAYPDNELFAFARVRFLLNDGKRLEAETYARLLSSAPPTETFETAERAVSALLELAFSNQDALF